MGVEGKVFSGLGEATDYVDQYNKHFYKRLGTEFYPGTLNLRLPKKIELEGGITVTPAEDHLWPVTCFPVKINSEIKGYIVKALRSSYGNDVVELVCQVNLRKKFDLNDGDMVKCELE